MKRFAIDVVLLPPEPVMNVVLKWNKDLVEDDRTNIILNTHDFLPHISMVMGCLPLDDLLRAQTTLKSIAANNKNLELQASTIRTIDVPDRRIVTLDIAHNHELIKLHESMVNEFAPLLTQDATDMDVFDLPPINPSTLEWINGFIPHQCFENFWPHITLGFGKLMPAFKPFTFRATRLAICHLGNHCTCRKILAVESLA